MKKAAFALTILSALPTLGLAAECPQSSVEVCFRPGEASCADAIVARIAAARSSLLVQAYDFTAQPIIEAIADAQKRGIDVRVLLDKENRQARYAGAVDRLRDEGVSVLIDDHVAIAHNKVIVIDGEITIGGSYNYSASAEKRNAENVTFITSRCVAQEFTENFEKRWALSAPSAPNTDPSLTADSLIRRQGPLTGASTPVRQGRPR